jgi:hypothetical protein
MGTMNEFKLDNVYISYNGKDEEAVCNVGIDWGNLSDCTIEIKSPKKNKAIYKKEMLKRMGVDRVIVNNKAVIVFLTNGDKGVAVCDENDYFDPMVGFSVAYAIAVGTKGNKTQFKKNLKKVL